MLFNILLELFGNSRINQTDQTRQKFMPTFQQKTSYLFYCTENQVNIDYLFSLVIS